MSWRDNLRRVTMPDGRRLVGGSFRGTPFFVPESERSGGGRRTVVHEFPYRDKPFVDDLGRRALSFPVQAYVLGDDYIRQRDELLTALDGVAGPGLLIHPYYGPLRAICSELSVRETAVDGGMAVFQITFTETPAQEVTPSEEVDLPEQVSGSADIALVAAKGEFVASYDVVGMPGHALESVAAALTTMSLKVRSALAPAVRVTQELARLDSQIRIMTAEASSLVRAPDEVLDSFLATFTSLAETATSAPGAIMDALVETYGTELGALAPETTLTRRRERANQIALAAALRRMLAIEAARIVPRVPFASLEEAASARDAIAAQLEEQASTAGDAAYPALVQLRSDVLRAVPSETVFARIVPIERRVAIPSLVLAYQIYGSVEQEQDIIDRNGVRHPGFVSGELKVLSDAG